MSEVISFRLDLDKNREATALAVIQTYQQRGFSVRQIITEALLRLDIEGDSPQIEQIAQVNKKLDDLSELLHSMNKKQLLCEAMEAKESSKKEISDHFKATVKVALKPGLCSG